MAWQVTVFSPAGAQDDQLSVCSHEADRQRDAHQSAKGVRLAEGAEGAEEAAEDQQMFGAAAAQKDVKADYGVRRRAHQQSKDQPAPVRAGRQGEMPDKDGADSPLEPFAQPGRKGRACPCALGKQDDKRQRAGQHKAALEFDDWPALEDPMAKPEAEPGNQQGLSDIERESDV